MSDIKLDNYLERFTDKTFKVDFLCKLYKNQAKYEVSRPGYFRSISIQDFSPDLTFLSECISLSDGCWILCMQSS